MQNTPPTPPGAYAASGVDIDASNRAKDLMAASVRSTRRPEVLADFGGFGGLFALSPLGLRDPVLVTSMDGVGTKLKVAFALNRHDTAGADLVNHCVNDILTCGARPLMFLDYLALNAVSPEDTAAVVAGVAAGCRANGCALIGGETAMMPGFYPPGEYDLAGCIIGIVERDRIISGQSVRAGDVAIGLPSVGLHTNGYSLARQVFDGLDWTAPLPELGGVSVGAALLAPHVSYLAPVSGILDDPQLGPAVTGMAHITGGGLLENIPRVVPAGLGVDLDAATWEILPIFREMQRRGQVAWPEMVRVFNIGIGFVLLVRPDAAPAIVAALSDAGGRIIGSVVDRADGEVVRVEGLPHA